MGEIDARRMTREEKERVHKRIHDLWEQGLNDGEISLEIGMKKSFVRHVRNLLDLETNWFGGLKENTAGERMRLYNQGRTDSEIARIEGVGTVTILNWRNYHGLPPHRERLTGERPGEPDPERYALWREGLDDIELGKKIGLTESGVRSWRRRHGLASNKKSADHKKRNKKQMTKAEIDLIREKIFKLWEDGLTDSQIAREIGCSSKYVWHIRQVLDLESNWFGGSKNVDHSNWANLYKQGLSDCEIAESSGVTSSSVWYWRQRRGLPSNSVYVRETGKPDPARYALWEKGMTDREIASAVGLKCSSVSTWRRKHGLKPNKKRAVHDEI